jgi:hypothetical protein
MLFAYQHSLLLFELFGFRFPLGLHVLFLQLLRLFADNFGNRLLGLFAFGFFEDFGWLYLNFVSIRGQF